MFEQCGLQFNLRFTRKHFFLQGNHLNQWNKVDGDRPNGYKERPLFLGPSLTHSVTYSFQFVFVHTGEAGNPGPSFLLEIANVTHFFNNIAHIVDREFNGLLCTEHTLSPDLIQCTNTHLGENFRTCFSKLDPELAHTGGVGCVLRGKRSVMQTVPYVSRLRKLIDCGRIGVFTIEISQDVFVKTYIVYGYTGGAKLMITLLLVLLTFLILFCKTLV